MLWWSFPLQVALTCGHASGAVSPQQLRAQIAVCVRDARDPAWQKHNPAITVLGLWGQPAVDPLDQCVQTEKDDEARARCVRALGEVHTALASERLLYWAAQTDLGPSTISALAIALGQAKDQRALPLLGRFVVDDEFPSHSAAITLFELDPTYYTRLPLPNQVAYAVGVADTGFLKEHYSATFQTHAPSLAKILAEQIKSGNWALHGKDILLIRWLHLLEQVGSAAHAADVYSLWPKIQDDSGRSSVLSLLSKWHAPLAVTEAQQVIAQSLSNPQLDHSLAVSSAGRYLRTLAADGNGEAALALGTLWQASGSSVPSTPKESAAEQASSVRRRQGVRCLLVFSYHHIKPMPPATEVAALIDSPCRHDMSILLDTPDPYLVDGLVLALSKARKDAADTDALRSALAWQCAKRLRLAVCKKAAPYLQGVRRPSHED